MMSMNSLSESKGLYLEYVLMGHRLITDYPFKSKFHLHWERNNITKVLKLFN